MFFLFMVVFILETGVVLAAASVELLVICIYRSIYLSKFI